MEVPSRVSLENVKTRVREEGRERRPRASSDAESI